MKSVKGMTWGSPEFVAMAKVAEQEGEALHEANHLLDELELAELSDAEWRKVRRRVAYMFELHEECDCNWY